MPSKFQKTTDASESEAPVTKTQTASSSSSSRPDPPQQPAPTSISYDKLDEHLLSWEDCNFSGMDVAAEIEKAKKHKLFMQYCETVKPPTTKDTEKTDNATALRLVAQSFGSPDFDPITELRQFLHWLSSAPKEDHDSFDDVKELVAKNSPQGAAAAASAAGATAAPSPAAVESSKVPIAMEISETPGGAITAELPAPEVERPEGALAAAEAPPDAGEHPIAAEASRRLAS